MWNRLVSLVRRGPALVTARVKKHHAKVSVDGLAYRYERNVEVLRNVSLNVRSGEFVCLLGPSGCGKTTLLYAMAGHIAPSLGSVSLNGKPISGPGPDRLLMFQDPALMPWLTVLGNVTFMLGALGVPREERETRARQMLKLVQLDGREDALPHELSGGMKMRCSLARALAAEPSVLLMDEPLSALDAQTRTQMHELVQDVWMKTRKTIVFVTHDIHEALVLASRLVVMAPKPGRIVRDLEVNLPFPRDPESARLAKVARYVRNLLRGLPVEEPPEEVADHETPPARAARGANDGAGASDEIPPAGPGGLRDSRPLGTSL
jgi:NitT/TauT family transport system ATP-binding protein